MSPTVSRSYSPNTTSPLMSSSRRGRPLRRRNAGKPAAVDKCEVVKEFEKEFITEAFNKSFSDVEDEVMDMIGVYDPRDNLLDEENSLPLTKLEYKPENLVNNKKLIQPLTTVKTDRHSNKKVFQKKGNKLKKSQTQCCDKPNKRDIVEVKTKFDDRFRTEIIKHSAEVGFSKCSLKYGISVKDIKAYIHEWIEPQDDDHRKYRRKTLPKKNNTIPSTKNDKIHVNVEGSHGHCKNAKTSSSDLSEMPLSHVKILRKELKKSMNFPMKKLKFKRSLTDKRNGLLKPPRVKSSITRKKIKLSIKSSLDTCNSSVSPDHTNNLSSVTVYDADVARPSRPIHRPVRYLDSLNQNTDNIAIKKLNIVDRFDLPYNKEDLVWNKVYSKNKQVLFTVDQLIIHSFISICLQNCYCYCGGPGSWHCKMVQCVRCSQWFHERCLAPRPYNMPIIPGDTFWLLVCSLCNSGSECLKRMDMNWLDIVHLSLYDLTKKTNRKFHDYDADLMPHILSNWKMLQLYKHHNIITDDDKRMKTKECLILDSERFESGAESKQDLNLWGLRKLVPPPRPIYKVPDIGIVSERTVLNEVTVASIVNHDRKETFHDHRVIISYKDYAELSKETEQIDKDMKSKKIVEKKSPNKTKKNISYEGLSSHLISNKDDLQKIQSAKVNFVALKLPKEIVKDTCRRFKLLKKKLPGKKKKKSLGIEVDKEISEPPSPPKPLPFEIAKILHRRGYPKVAMKFASIIPPKRDVVVQPPNQHETPPDQKHKKKRSKKENLGKDSSIVQVNRVDDSVKNSLSSLIPERPDYFGDNNPFHLGSVEEQREARKVLCNRQLKEEDLTKWRYKIKKRKYRLNFEQARQMWKKESSSPGKNTPKRSSCIKKSPEKFQYAGKFIAPSGETKIIMMRAESQQLEVEA